MWCKNNGVHKSPPTGQDRKDFIKQITDSINKEHLGDDASSQRTVKTVDHQIFRDYRVKQLKERANRMREDIENKVPVPNNETYPVQAINIDNGPQAGDESDEDDDDGSDAGEEEEEDGDYDDA